jgi:4-amino-4-deoxy-L-arabinose transferase-like glycosyltransferase
VDIAQVSAFRLVIYRTQRFAYRASRIGWNKVLLWALVAVGAGLRLSLIVGQRFHGDEAIYGYWAQLVASGQDPLLISVPLDKPPLFIYLLAGVFRLLGPTEVAARLINQAASVAAVPLTYWLGRRLYTRQAALMAAAMMALSPFNILFAPTAFTDPFMGALILAAMALAADGRCGWAGLLAGLAVATKQQGLFFVPLIFTLGWTLRPHASRPNTRQPVAKSRAWDMAQMGLAFLSVMLLVTGWDALRWRLRPSFWVQSAVSHGPLHLASGWELGERLAGWSTLLGYVFGSPLLNAILLLGVPFLLWRNRRAVRGHSETSAIRADWLLATFGTVFVLIHWLFSFRVWDRYLLGLVPLASLLLARVVEQIAARAGTRWMGVIGLVVLLLLARPALKAVQEAYPIGGDHGAYQGLEEVIAFFRHEVPDGSVVWHRYLGWHYFHYLFDAPLNLRWYATPEVLAAKVSQGSDVANYVAFPAWEKAAEPEAQAALKAVGLCLRPERRVWREDGRLAFAIFRIVAGNTKTGVKWMTQNP